MPVVPAQLPQASQRPFVTYDGHHLALFDWALPAPTRPRAVVLLLHGRGEHAWLYDTLAGFLNAGGYAVRAYDQRGHGSSAGKRGAMPHDDTLLQDLTEVVADTRLTYSHVPNLPIVLCGHELGALVAASWVSLHPSHLTGSCPIDGLVLSALMMPRDLHSFTSWLLSHCPDCMGHVSVPIRSIHPPLFRSHVPASLRHVDPLCHSTQSIKLVRFSARAATRLLSDTGPWKIPTLVLHSDPVGLQRQVPALRWATQLPREWVRIRRVPIASDSTDEPAICAEASLMNWLNTRF